MTTSASVRKSLSDLSRRRARTVFTVLTLALAVASVSFLAIPTLIDHTMQQEVRDGRLADVTVDLRPVELGEDDLAALEDIPGVEAVEARSSIDVRVLVGERRAAARIIGIRDFSGQRVDIARIETGAFPAEGEVLSDVQNANVGVYDGGAGDRLTVLTGDGDRRDLVVSGRGRTLPGGELVQDENVIVLYARATTVTALGGEPGVGRLALRLEDPASPDVDATLDAVRSYLTSVPGFGGFADLPEVRSPGDWPGRSDTEAFAKVLGVITMLALLSAVVLIANTIGTLVAEQTREIAVMRALGARRRQVAFIYVRTAALLGVLGAVIGTALGILMAYALARSFGSTFWAVDVGFGVDPTIAVASVAVGLAAPPLAALPSIRRALLVDLRAALDATGSTTASHGATDRLLRHLDFLPRSLQIGLRNTGVRKRRTLATSLIVALAVGNLLAVLAIADAATLSTRKAWGDHLEDLQVSTAGRELFGPVAARSIAAVPGVAEVEPVLKNTVSLAGREAFVWGTEVEPLFRYRLASGRWFDDAEAQRAEPVAVIERNLAQIVGITVGDEVALRTAEGDAQVRIVGIAKNQQEDGTALYLPLPTVQSLLGRPDGATAYWVRTDSSDSASVDRTTALVEDRLAELGYAVSTEITYVAERDEVAANRSLTTTITLLGFVVVALSMVGLANAVTTNVLERTREIGILRCIGARGRHVRSMFSTEGLVLALYGWVLGIPLGYLFTRLFVRLVWELIDVRIPVLFPLEHLPLALIGTVVLALAVLQLPVRRAVRLRAGDALRYA